MFSNLLHNTKELFDKVPTIGFHCGTSYQLGQRNNGILQVGRNVFVALLFMLR